MRRAWKPRSDEERGGDEGRTRTDGDLCIVVRVAGRPFITQAISDVTFSGPKVTKPYITLRLLHLGDLVDKTFRTLIS